MTITEQRATQQAEERRCFEERRQRRRQTFMAFESEFDVARARYGAVVERVRRDGFAVMPGALDRRVLTGIREAMVRCLQQGAHLHAPISVHDYDGTTRYGAGRRLEAGELAKGVEGYRQLTTFVQIVDPLIHLPPLLDLALSDVLLDVASVYLNCFAGLGFIKVQRSFVNASPLVDTNFFHVGDNFAMGEPERFLKAVVYLEDVDERGGPFSYVRGSHREKPAGWDRKNSCTPEEIAALYGPGRVVPLVGSVGDLIFADTAGFHCGAKPASRDRWAMFLNYVLEEEYEGRGKKARVAQADVLGRTPKQCAAAEFLEVWRG